MHLDSQPISCKSLESFFGVNGKLLQEQYKEHMSDFKNWKQRKHAQNYLLYPQNIGTHLSIDETSLSNGELYTILTNKAAKGRKGCLVALIKGTETESICKVLRKISHAKRRKVQEVTLDMAGSMNKIVKACFTRASKVIDRFHVQKLASEAVQDLRIAHRWEAIKRENRAIKRARANGKKYEAVTFENGDTRRQLLARSRYLLFKPSYKWSESQKLRAELLFENYPDVETAYNLASQLRDIFSKTKDKAIAFTKLARWYERVEKEELKSFGIIANSIKMHYEGILNYFDNRSTNASAESFNAKIKAFRSCFRGVRDIPFFLFRLANIYA